MDSSNTQETELLTFVTDDNFNIVEITKALEEYLHDIGLSPEDVVEFFFDGSNSQLDSLTDGGALLKFFTKQASSEVPKHSYWRVTKKKNYFQFSTKQNFLHSHSSPEYPEFQAFEKCICPVMLISSKDNKEEILYVNDAFELQLGYTSPEVKNRTLALIFFDGEKDESLEHVRNDLHKHQSSTLTAKCRRKDGSCSINQLNFSLLTNDVGRIEYLVIFNDVTNLLNSNKQHSRIHQIELMTDTFRENVHLQDSSKQLPKILGQLAEVMGGYSALFHGVIEQNNIKSLSVSNNLLEPLVDKNRQSFINFVSPYLDGPSPVLVDLTRETRDEKKEIKNTVTELRKLGVESLAIFLLRDLKGTVEGFFVFCFDVSEHFDSKELSLISSAVGSYEARLHIEERERLSQGLGLHDELTGLPTRWLFLEQIKNLNNTIDYHNNLISCVAVVDVTILNKITKTISHLEKIYNQVTNRFDEVLPEDTIIGKLDNSAFAIYFYCDTEQKSPYQLIDKWMSSVFGKVFEGLWSNDHRYRLTPSIGYAVSNNIQEASELLQNAEIASQESSSLNPIVAYKKKMRDDFVDQLALESELIGAIENFELELFYQPKINLRKNKIVSVEALMRWNHPKRGLIPPAKFIPALESSGLIKGLTFWLFESAHQATIELTEKLERPIRVAINISYTQLTTDSFEKDIIAFIEKYHIKPANNLIDIEITESFLVTDLQLTKQRLLLLTKLGFVIAIDDFGTGYSSLSYLTSLNYDQLKIDMRFIRDMMTSPDDMALVSGIINLARSMDKIVIAEGVENHEQARLLKLLNCHEVQGYLIGRPGPLAKFDEVDEDIFKLAIGSE